MGITSHFLTLVHLRSTPFQSLPSFVPAARILQELNQDDGGSAKGTQLQLPCVSRLEELKRVLSGR